MVSDVVGASAIDIAAQVQGGSLRPAEVVGAHLDHITVLDPALNAFRVVRHEAAMTEAAELERRDDLRSLPLAGVPVTVKDNVTVAGETNTNGSAAAGAQLRGPDHAVVARLRAAGAIVIGITTCPELCLWGTTDGYGGVTRNPWDLGRTPGGSSGGSGAAVAAAMAPIGHASDGLGSIRIPAAACGLFGIKPGRGVVPAELGTSSWFGMSEHGPLATTVQDAAVMLAVLARRPSLAELPDPRPLRIGVSVRSPMAGVGVDPAWREGVLRTADLLARNGHEIVDARLDYPTRAALALNARWYAGAHEDAAGLAFDELEERTRRHVKVGAVVNRLGLVRDADRHAWRAKAGRALRRFDVLLTPTLACDPISSQAWSARSWTSNVTANIRYAPFPSFWNLAGFPAASVPVPARDGGPPRAVQLVTPDGGEPRLLALAAHLEQLQPWERHAPMARTAAAGQR
jgi:amidase